jgi:hypothetical protein
MNTNRTVGSNLSNVPIPACKTLDELIYATNSVLTAQNQLLSQLATMVVANGSMKTVTIPAPYTLQLGTYMAGVPTATGYFTMNAADGTPLQILARK